MKMIIKQLSQHACGGRDPGRRRERRTEAFQAAIDFFRLDVGRTQAPSRTVTAAQAGAEEPPPPITHPST